MPRIFTLVPKSFGSNTYYVTDGKSSFLVDPSVGVEEAERVLGNDFLPPTAILLTHGHFDHVEALPEWYAAFSPSVYIGREDAPMLSDGYLNAHAVFFGEDKRYFVPHTPISDGCVLSLCGESITATWSESEISLSRSRGIFVSTITFLSCDIAISSATSNSSASRPTAYIHRSYSSGVRVTKSRQSIS